jgi:hypothetical protein
MAFNGADDNIVHVVRMNRSAERLTMKPEQLSGTVPMGKMVHPVDEYFLVYSSQDYFHLFLCFKAFFIGGFPIMKRTFYPTLVI